MTDANISISHIFYDALFAADPDQELMALRSWVCAEVLPSIHATGGYLLNPAARESANAANWYQWPDGGRLLDRYARMIEMAHISGMAVQAVEDADAGVLDI